MMWDSHRHLVFSTESTLSGHTTTENGMAQKVGARKKSAVTHFRDNNVPERERVVTKGNKQAECLVTATLKVQAW